MEKENQIAIWLKKLEQESWQLELLVSGFTIFLLIGAYEGLSQFAKEFQFHYDPDGVFFVASVMLLYIILACVLVLIVNLVLHLALRGFWIGAIGLRSVGPALDFDDLKYQVYFVERLKKNMVSMDDLIVRLDRLCSAIFSFTFLIIFLFLSFFIFLLVLVVMSWGINVIINVAPTWLSPIVEVISVVIIVCFLLGGVLYLFDSLSLGLLKKVRWIQKVYYPIYAFFSTITLSFLYRSIYYNLITKFHKGIIRLTLVAYILLISFTPFFALDDYRYFPDNFTKVSMNSDFYDDQRLTKSFIRSASIPSMTLKDNLLPLFVRYNTSDNATLAVSCPDFEPAKKGGLKHGLDTSNGNLILSRPDIDEPFPEAALACLTNFYSLTIDSKSLTAERTYFYVHPNKEEKGLMMLINIESLSIGPHTIEVSRKILQDSVLKKEDYVNIPFWRH